MISNRPMIPMLTHVDNLGDLNLDMTSQEQSLETIASNTESASYKLGKIENSLERVELVVQQIDMNTAPLEQIENNTSSIKTSSANTATATSSLNSAVGTTTDVSTSNTVIGLLKSIANKL